MPAFEVDAMPRSNAFPATVLALLVTSLAEAAHGQVVTEFPLPPSSDGQPWSITAGPDGALWFTEIFGSESLIGRITTAGVVSEFRTPVYAGPSDIVTGPDGNLWFPNHQSYAGGIRRMTTTGDFKEFPIPTPGGHPEAIAVGPDGNLWFTDGGVNRIGRITMTGNVTEFVIPTTNGTPRGIAAGRDGNLWFTETDGNRIGRISTAGVITEFPIPTAKSSPWKIVAGPDGNMWFTEDPVSEDFAGKIGRITAAGVITEFPSRCGIPHFITAGADGNLWFTGEDVCRMTTEGVVTKFDLSFGAGPLGIAAGPDGNIWFTDTYRRKIGRIATGLCSRNAATLCLNEDRFRVGVTWSVPSEGRHGIGTAVPLTGDTGYFWFFDGDNVELVIKILDGRTINGRFWVFYGALSNIQYTITVTDTATGAVKSYENPYGTLASVADTLAFGSAGEAVAASTASAAEDVRDASTAELYGLYELLSEAAAGPRVAGGSSCTPGGTTLCLNQSRFQLAVDWEVPGQGFSGHGMAVPVTGDTGYFWFFDSDNVELVVKILDGRAINGRFWVFYGALSDVQYTISVTDTQTGAVRTYTNPSGTLASVADTSAF